MALKDFIQSISSGDTVYSTPPKPSIKVIPPSDNTVSQKVDAKPFVKIIPPESIVTETPAGPATIKLNINMQEFNFELQKQQAQQSNPNIVQQQLIQQQVQPQQVYVQQPIQQQQVVQQQVQQPVISELPNNVPQQQINVIPPQPIKEDNLSRALNNSNIQFSQGPQDIPFNNVNVESKPIVQSQAPIIKTKEMIEEELFNSTGTEDSKKEIWFEYYHKACTSRKNNQIVERVKAGRFTITPDNKVLLLPDYDIVGKDPDDVLKDKWF